MKLAIFIIAISIGISGCDRRPVVPAPEPQPPVDPCLTQSQYKQDLGIVTKNVLNGKKVRSTPRLKSKVRRNKRR